MIAAVDDGEVVIRRHSPANVSEEIQRTKRISRPLDEKHGRLQVIEDLVAEFGPIASAA